MPRRHSRVWPALWLLPSGLWLLSAAAPPADLTPADLVRRGNALFPVRDDPAEVERLAEADRLYATAEELTTDPGLVAFNRAAVLFRRGEYRDAELHYARVLDDAACPPDRAARSWYNRGACLLHRGGSAAVFRSAIACFERCLESPAPDAPLKADARHNLELAKERWNEARKTAPKPPTPNEDPPPEDPWADSPPPAGGSDMQPGTPEPGEGNATGATRSVAQPNPVPVGGTQPNGGQQSPSPGNAPHLQPLPDTDQVQPLSPEDTREYLRRAEERLKKDRQTLLRTLYGPDRPGVRDW